MRVTPGSSANSTSNRARSAWACSPGGVLEPNFERVTGAGRMFAHRTLHRGVTAGVAALS